MPRQVVQSVDGRDLADGGVGPVVIVEVESGRECYMCHNKLACEYVMVTKFGTQPSIYTVASSRGSRFASSLIRRGLRGSLESSPEISFCLNAID